MPVSVLTLPVRYKWLNASRSLHDDSGRRVVSAPA